MRQRRGSPADDRDKVTQPADGVSHPILLESASLLPVPTTKPRRTPPEAVESACRWLCGGWQKYEEERLWIVSILHQEHVPEPSARLSEKGAQWTVRSRRSQIGKLRAIHVEARRADLVARVAEMRRAITIDLKVVLCPADGSKRQKWEKDDIWNNAKSMPVQLQRDKTDGVFDNATGEFFATSEIVSMLTNATLIGCLRAGLEAKVRPILDTEFRRLRLTWGEGPSKWDQRRASVSIVGAVIDLLRKQTEEALTRWRKNERAERFPLMRPNGPIPLRAENVQLRITKEGGIDVGLHVTDTGGWCGGWRFFGGSVRGHAHRSLLKGQWRILGSKLRWDKLHKRWSLHLGVATKRPPLAKGDETLIVRIGVRDFLFGLDTTGWISYFGSTSALLNSVRGLQARKADKKSSVRNGSGGRKGHGRRRRYREYTDIRGLEENFTATWWNQVAANLVETCAKRGYGRVIVQDMSKPSLGSLFKHADPEFAKVLKSFPSAKGRDAIVWACEKVGVGATVVTHAHDPVTCPACGCSEPRNYRARGDHFRCMGCDLLLAGQFVAAWNTMKANGIDDARVAKRARTISKQLHKFTQQVSQGEPVDVEVEPEAAE